MSPRFPFALLLAATLGASSFAASCGGGGEPFFPEDYETSFVAVSGCVTSIDHDFNNVRIWADPAAETAYCAGDPLPVGTVIVKEEFDDDACTELVGWTAMRKEEAGFNPDANDWNWQRLNARGRVREDGAIDACIDCHGFASATSCPSADYTCLDFAARCP